MFSFKHSSLIIRNIERTGLYLLIVVLILNPINGIAESQKGYMQVSETDSVYRHVNLKSIYESPEERAKLTVFLAMDLCIAFGDTDYSSLSQYLSYPSYVSHVSDTDDMGTILDIIIQDKLDFYSMLFISGEKTGEASACLVYVYNYGGSSGTSDNSSVVATIDISDILIAAKEKDIKSILDGCLSSYQNSSDLIEEALDEVLESKQDKK